MGRQARRRGASASALTLLAWLLVILQLPAPASPAPPVKFVRPALSFIRNIPNIFKNKAVRPDGSRALVKESLSSSVGGDPGKAQLGSAAAVDAGFVTYAVAIGGGAKTSGIVNIADDFVWVQCPSLPAGASKFTCGSQKCQEVLPGVCGDAAHDDCDYVATYAAVDTTGYLASGTFTAAAGADSTVPPVTGTVVFGCATESSEVPLAGQSGIIGFSKGGLSLVTQLKISRFSYFLAPDNSVSVVLLNDEAKPDGGSRSTPLVRGNLPDLYYVKLTGIHVDGQALTGIPAWALDGNSGGVLLSTTSAITYLQPDAYKAVRQALVSKIKWPEVNGSAPDDGSLCYNMQAVAGLTFPKLTLVFDGSPAPTMELTTVNYFYKDSTTGLQCLTMLPMTTTEDEPASSILGSLLQTGTNMIYDIDGGSLTFEKRAASATSSRVSSLMAMAPLFLAWGLLF